MATTKQDIRQWIENAPKNATHMAVVCDTFDYDDFPVYVHEGEDPKILLGKYERGENMTRLMEVYNLKVDIEKQLDQDRSFNY